MATKNMRPSGPKPCKCLRSKEMFYKDASQEDVFASGYVWCQHTQDVIGADGAVASPEECIAGRKCFEG